MTVPALAVAHHSDSLYRSAHPFQAEATCGTCASTRLVFASSLRLALDDLIRHLEPTNAHLMTTFPAAPAWPSDSPVGCLFCSLCGAFAGWVSC